MESLIKFWSDVRNVENACAEDIQKDILAYLRRLAGAQQKAAEWENTARTEYHIHDEVQDKLREAQKTRSDLSTRLQFHDDHADSDHQAIERLIAENIRLRKALEEALREYETGDMESDFGNIIEKMYEGLKSALEVES